LFPEYRAFFHLLKRNEKKNVVETGAVARLKKKLNTWIYTRMSNHQEEIDVASDVSEGVDVDLPYLLSEVLTYKDHSITSVLYQILCELKTISKAMNEKKS
jgi:hypothetical protein